MKKQYCLLISVLVFIILLLIGVITVLMWSYFPKTFEDTTSDIKITRSDEFVCNLSDGENGKIGRIPYGYQVTSDEATFIDKLLIYDLLWNLKLSDVRPEMPPPHSDMNSFNALVGSDKSFILFSCDPTREYIRVMRISSGGGDVANGLPTFFTTDPNKVTKLINRLIARAEKLHPDYYYVKP